jgi:spore coat protein U-like protein
MTFTVSMSTICSFGTTTAVSFGNVVGGTLPADVTAQGAVSVTCPSGTPYTVYLGDGNNRIAGGSRQMSSGSARLPYQLYKSATVSAANVWDTTGMGSGLLNGSGGVSKTGTGAATVTTIYGVIPAGTVTPSTLGAYSDTVVATVVY